MLRYITDDADAARRKYKKDLDHLKPDLVAYNQQKEMALGLAPGTLTSFNPKSGEAGPVRSFHDHNDIL